MNKPSATPFIHILKVGLLAPLLALGAALACAATSATETFQGVIARSGADSTAHWAAPQAPPKDAPNILIWLMDDVGFGHWSNFGGLIDTPSLDSLADSGLRFSNFHATPLCSPTRASLLTGRNPHAVGMGSHANTASGFPGYNARIPASAAGIGRILKDQGYATYALGKWDQLPAEHTSPLGPFDYWPSGQGFEHFYGFLTYDTHQFTPLMWRDHTPAEVPADPGYHVTTDLADQAITWIRAQHGARPDQPFLMYWSTGAVHAPHHAPRDFIAKYKGRFDMGWNAAREMILERQKRLGLVPANAELPAWADNVPTWDSLSADQRRMAARAMEVYAAMLDHADHEFGRIVAALRETGTLDNTLILVVSDNGTSAEGGIAGSFNELLMGQVDWAENLERIDDWGSDKTYPHYPVGWAAAGNTPFKHYKQSSFEGGNRVPMLVHWPRGIHKTGEIRSQYHHVNDILPTVLDITGIGAPDSVAGVEQQPMDGISFRYAFDDATASTRKQHQYYELWGNHGLWANGWKANVQLRKTPWDVFKPVSLDDAVWELYHVDEDFNERFDLAESHPEKLAEMQQLFDQLARDNNVYPLLPDFIADAQQRLMQSLREREGRFVLRPGTERLPHVLAPPINLFSFTSETILDNEDKVADGVIYAFGGSDGGYTLYIEDGRPVFAHNHMRRDTTFIRGKQRLAAGTSTLSFSLHKTGPTTGTGTLAVNGKVVAEGELKNLGDRLPSHETFDVGIDWGSTVVAQNTANGRMPTGIIRQVDIRIDLPAD
ncbi:MAG: arylsulfatase [Porticoccaceae bacterium]